MSRPLPAVRSVPIRTALIALGVTVVAVLLGLQLITPNRRIIEAAMGVLLTVLCFRYPLFWSLAVFTVLMLFPVGLSVGNSNVVLIFVMLSVWAFRVAFGQSRPRFRTGADGPVLLLVAAYVLSFFDVSNPRYLTMGLVNLSVMFGCVMLFYLVVNFVQSERGLETVARFMCLGAFLVMLTALYQAIFPGQPLIPGWILPHYDPSLAARNPGLRLGGAFGSHDALADYGVIMLFLEYMMIVRSRSMSRRIMWAVLIGLTLFAIMATANRGGLTSLVVGVFYMLWLARRHVRIVPATLTLVGAVLALWMISTALADYTNIASMFARVVGTKFKGLTPDTRVGIWSTAFNRGMERPFLGHGPYYDISAGAAGVEKIYWPHNGFIWAFFITGVVGFVAFCWVILSLGFRSRRYASGSLGDPSFARAFMTVLHVQIVLFVVSQLRTDYQRWASYMFFIWLLFGLVAATAQVIRSQEEEALAAEGPLPATPRSRFARPQRAAVARTTTRAAPRPRPLGPATR